MRIEFSNTCENPKQNRVLDAASEAGAVADSDSENGGSGPDHLSENGMSELDQL